MARKKSTETTAPETETTVKVKEEKPLNPCMCGCGTMVKNRFAQGHDARYKGMLLRIIYSPDPATTDDMVIEALNLMTEQKWDHKVDPKKAKAAADKRAGVVPEKKAKAKKEKAEEVVPHEEVTEDDWADLAEVD